MVLLAGAGSAIAAAATYHACSRLTSTNGANSSASTTLPMLYRFWPAAVATSDTDDPSYVKPVLLPLAPNNNNSGDASCGSPAPPLLLPLTLRHQGLRWPPPPALEPHLSSAGAPISRASRRALLAVLLLLVWVLELWEARGQVLAHRGIPDFLSLCVSGSTVASCLRGDFDGAAGTATTTGSSLICSSIVALRLWPASFVDADAGATLVASSAGLGLLSSTKGVGIVLPVRCVALLAYVGAGALTVLLLLLTYNDGTPATLCAPICFPSACCAWHIHVHTFEVMSLCVHAPAAFMLLAVQHPPSTYVPSFSAPLHLGTLCALRGDRVRRARVRAGGPCALL
ncbi:hypothetical protein DFH07DRAFT_969267 [Mycena maculata]|uniref:Uncharacterized protein n=1 Tax=Mycena maculata TaxID=230809 RepID=A0AAD7MSN7_9AGAR|nr:hypothetical protein DFH07DRAFT_969267 [Mycena maculata]